MAPDAAHDDILEPCASNAEELLLRLSPERWPVPIEALPAETALVGGAVRDALMNRLSERPDLDLVVPGNALDHCRDLAAAFGGSSVILDAERDMARLVLNGWTIDFARRDGRSLDDDLRRRDFTINAIALPVKPPATLVDPTGGLQDLRNRQLKAVCERNLTDDPLRLLRGVRLMAELPLRIDKGTLAWMQLHRDRLQEAAPERILSELQRLVAAPNTDQALLILKRLQLLAPWQDTTRGLRPPPGEQQALEFSAEERDRWLPLGRITQLISDQGLERLRAGRQLRQRCRRLRRWVDRLPEDPAELQERDRYELHLDLKDDLPALILHLPHHLQRTWLRRWRDSDDPLFHPASPVDGSDLQRVLGLTPGPAIGQLLDHLRRERAFQRIDSATSALAEAQRWCTLNSNLL